MFIVIWFLAIVEAIANRRRATDLSFSEENDRVSRPKQNRRTHRDRFHCCHCKRCRIQKSFLFLRYFYRRSPATVSRGKVAEEERRQCFGTLKKEKNTIMLVCSIARTNRAALQNDVLFRLATIERTRSSVVYSRA